MMTLKQAARIMVSQIWSNEFLSAFFLSFSPDRKTLFRTISEINQTAHMIANRVFTRIEKMLNVECYMLND